MLRHWVKRTLLALFMIVVLPFLIVSSLYPLPLFTLLNLPGMCSLALILGVDRNDSGFSFTPVQFAAALGRERILIQLLARRADANGTGTVGLPPLHLVSVSPMFDTATGETRLKPLAVLLAENYVPFLLPRGVARTAIAAMLLQCGARVDEPMQGGITALHVALRHNRLDLADLLLAHGASLESRTTDGQTPAHFAATSPNSDQRSLEWLQKRNADLNARTKENGTPLYMAILCGQYQKANWLAEQGMTLEGPGSQTPTLLHALAHTGFDERLYNVLRARQVDPAIRDTEGKTVLQVARQGGNVPLIKALEADGIRE